MPDSDFIISSNENALNSASNLALSIIAFEYPFALVSPPGISLILCPFINPLFIIAAVML